MGATSGDAEHEVGCTSPTPGLAELGSQACKVGSHSSSLRPEDLMVLNPSCVQAHPVPCECSAGKTCSVPHGPLEGRHWAGEHPAIPPAPSWSFNSYEQTGPVESGEHRCVPGPSSVHPRRKWTQEARLEPVLYRSLLVFSVSPSAYIPVYFYRRGRGTHEKIQNTI